MAVYTLSKTKNMMKYKIDVFVATALFLMLGCLHPASAQTAAGWKTEVAGRTVVLTPLDLAAREFYQITIYPRTSMGGALITDFVDSFGDRDAAARGKPTGTTIPPTAHNHNHAVAVRQYTNSAGRYRLALYQALSVDGENARVISTAASSMAVFKQYQPQMEAVVAEMLKQEKATALASGRGLKVEELPPTPPGMTPGGKLVPGIYAGNQVYTDEGKIGNRMRLYLYASGECRLCNEKGEDYRFGADDYTYDPITGKIDVGQQYAIYNSVLGPGDAYSLYGRDSEGKPYLYAHDGIGFHDEITILHYVGPADRPSPKQQEAQKAAAEAEAARYKYVVAPGKGVQASQIAGVFHHYDLRLNQGAALNESYLLLKDGTVHDGLPVPPDELDVPLSHRREPEKWGRWRRQGDHILAAWPDSPNRYATLQGFMAVPGRTGERMNGRFATGQTSGSVAFGGSYSVWGVTFTPGGRFEKSGYGGSSSGSLGATINDFSVNTQSDDEGSTASFSSPGAVGYASKKKRGSSRAGTYSVSGYSMTLRYDNGHVERIPFFFEDAKRDQIYFEGSSLGLDDGK